MNVLLIGGGGREHAMARSIAASPRLETLYATGWRNPGIAAVSSPVPFEVSSKDLGRLRRFCDSASVDLVVIGPEGPLSEGYADELSKRESGEPRGVFGPVADGAKIEADKAFSKRVMRSASVPTPDGRVFQSHEMAVNYLESRDEAPVIKAAGLAKGKGVFVPETLEQARSALDTLMLERRFGDAGDAVVIEDRVTGREVSAMALVDGETIMLLPHCQDYKRLGAGDTGPNTGGMGAICPAPPLDDSTAEVIERDIIIPTVSALRREGIEFRGVLYAGLMLTPAGPQVLEFNARFGDPECQAILARLESDALDLLHATATGRLDLVTASWSSDPSICLVLAAEGYPTSPRSGQIIVGIDEAEAQEGVSILHAGTTTTPNGEIMTAGGRVLNIIASGQTAELARERAYAAAERIHFPGKYVRRDIGLVSPSGVTGR